MKRAMWTWAAVAAQSLALVGCGGFAEIDFTLRSTPPDSRVYIFFDKIRIPEAIAVGVIAKPMESDDVMAEDTKVVLQSKNPDILGVGPSPPVAGGPWAFVIFGVSEGTTEVTVRIDGELETPIPAIVLPQ